MKQIILIFTFLFTILSYSQNNPLNIDCNYLKNEEEKRVGYAQREGTTFSWCTVSKPTANTKCMCERERKIEAQKIENDRLKSEIKGLDNKMSQLRQNSKDLYNKFSRIESNIETSNNFESDKKTATTYLQKCISNYRKIISLTEQKHQLSINLSSSNSFHSPDYKVLQRQIEYYQAEINHLKGRNPKEKGTSSLSLGNSSGVGNGYEINNNSSKYQETETERKEGIDRENAQRIRRERQEEVNRINQQAEIYGSAAKDLTSLTISVINSGIFKGDPAAKARRQREREKRKKAAELYDKHIEENKKETLSSNTRIALKKNKTLLSLCL